MTRTLSAALALAAGLTAAPALAQPYGQPYPDSRYGQQQYPSQDDRRDDRGYQDRSDQDRGYQDRGYQPPPSGYDDRRADDRSYGSQGAPDYVDRQTYTSRTHPDRVDGDSRYERDPRQIDPAPGANGPYVGVGPQRFYDVDDRIARVGSRLAALPASQRKKAYAEFRSIQAEERTQRARHGGELRDWDREHLNQRLDALMRRYPWLGR